MMQDTAQLYQAVILARSRHPRFAGRPEQCDAVGEGDNPMCGDHVRVFRQADGAVTHEARGCAILSASADLMAEAVAGRGKDDIAGLRRAFAAMVNDGVADERLGDLNALVGVAEYRSRIRCAMLPWDALTQAMEGEQSRG